MPLGNPYYSLSIQSEVAATGSNSTKSISAINLGGMSTFAERMSTAQALKKIANMYTAMTTNIYKASALTTKEEVT